MVLRSYCKGLRVGRELVAEAYDTWSCGDAGRKNRWRVWREHGGPDGLVTEIADEIAGRSLSFSPVHRYPRHEPTNGKLRIICVESVKQQVCDYLAVLCLRPLLDAKIGYYQCGSTDGKGCVFVRDALRRWAHEATRRTVYYVKSDVRRCYPSISHELVMGILRRYVRSPDVLYLCEALLGTYGDGLDIGSYFSLKMSQLVLSFAYHKAEGMRKVRRGRGMALVAHQIWNMDDCLFMGYDKRGLKSAVRRLEAYMRDSLGLTLKPWQVCRVSEDEPIDMCGFRVTPTRVTLRKRLFISAFRAHRRYERCRTQRMAARCCAYWGWYLHSDSEAHRHRRGIDRISGSARRLGSRTSREATVVRGHKRHRDQARHGVA